jgi:midasin (ATPase involved in ribosome maturation)
MLWNELVLQMNSLSFSLCEQLRLILEPTVATKYKGDYRTGKRLNMRKLIPYIASNYKKDKIWLRRTKPSKRTYQIMLSIDDSKSMKESGCDALAFQSVALISKALTQLEAGEISVVGFGQDSSLIHDFSNPFTDDSGVNVVQNLKFDQDKTDVLKMLKASLGTLERARTSRNQDLWQLLLILSDGICDDHAAIKSLVAHAAQMQIMIVFMVLDTRQERDSITKMSTVSYDMTSPDGIPKLQMSRYLSSFPFEYYIILRDINALPTVLAETLRQYFSFVNM